MDGTVGTVRSWAHAVELRSTTFDKHNVAERTTL